MIKTMFYLRVIPGARDHELDHALNLPLLWHLPLFIAPTIARSSEIINLENLLRSFVQKCENYLFERDYFIGDSTESVH